jgi:glucose-1-phosphate thymidylyltransferase
MIGIRGILLAGGSGSRLLPLTKNQNKHMLPVGRKSMIVHPLEKLVGAGITDIMLVTGTEHMGGIMGLLGSGKDFGCRLTYRVQDQAGGIAQALGLCEDFVGRDHCCVILGDNIFTDYMTKFATRFATRDGGSMILLKKVNDAQRFGVAEVANGKIISIEEKPKRPKSDLAVTGIYFYDHRVFGIIRTLKPSGRGELEITDVNNAYIRRGEMEYEILAGNWTDAGTFDSLHRANILMQGE